MKRESALAFQDKGFLSFKKDIRGEKGLSEAPGNVSRTDLVSKTV